MPIGLVNYASLAINAVNVALTLGLFFYTLRIRGFFKGGTIGKPMPIFAAASFFLFLAAVFRAALLWGLFTADFEPLGLGTRTVGFILLFAFAYYFVRAWSNVNK